MNHAGHGGLKDRTLTNAIVLDVRLRSASKGVTGAGSGRPGNGVYRVKRGGQKGDGGWY